MRTTSATEYSDGNTHVHKPDRFAERFVTRQQAEHYRDRFKKGRRAWLNRLERSALREMGERINHIDLALDLPSGTGRLSGILAEFSNNVILADHSLAMLEVAREQLSGLRFKYLSLDADKIGLADRSVDLIFCHRFLTHIFSTPQRARILAEIRRVTRRYVILSYYPPGFRSRWRAFGRRLLRRYNPDAFQPSLNQFREEIRTAGLRLVRSVAIRCFPVTGTFFLFEREEFADRTIDTGSLNARGLPR
jgi:ubiquinone/menaquinone biosynthesis C-methylase UbiE